MENDQLRKIFGSEMKVVPHCPKGHPLWYNTGVSIKTLYKKYNINLTKDQLPPGLLKFLERHDLTLSSGKTVVILKQGHMDSLTRKTGKKCRECEASKAKD